jgi:hypothetical protein
MVLTKFPPLLQYKWRIGIMTELAPEGYVGVSPVCLLGFNRNRGMEISLRLRTDDLAGFRKYNSIRQTLLHELTHMVHDEHDEHFKALNSLLNREAEALDWTRKKAHTLGGKAAADSEEESESSDGEEVGQVLGGGNAPVLDPRQAAAAAAMRRDAEKRRREAEGRSTADVADDVIMDGLGDSPGRSGRSVEVGGMQDAVKESPMEAGEGNNEVGREEAVEGGGKGDRNMEREEAGTPTGHQKLDEDMGVNDRDKTEGTGPVNERLLGVEEASEGASERRSRAASSEPDPDDGLGPRKRATEPHESESMRSEPDETSSRPQNDKAVEAEFEQRQTGMEHMQVDSVSGAVLEGPQVTTESGDQETPSGSDAGATGGNDEWQRAQEAAAEASGRIQKAVADLKQQAGPGEVTLTLRTLATILHNVMEHPSEPKYRRVRKTNAAFFERVGRFEGVLPASVVDLQPVLRKILAYLAFKTA